MNRFSENTKAANGGAATHATNTSLAALQAGALNLLLRHDETGCRQAAQQALLLLERLHDAPGLDAETQALCERASVRLDRRLRLPAEVACRSH